MPLLPQWPRRPLGPVLVEKLLLAARVQRHYLVGFGLSRTGLGPRRLPLQDRQPGLVQAGPHLRQLLHQWLGRVPLVLRLQMQMSVALRPSHSRLVMVEHGHRPMLWMSADQCLCYSWSEPCLLLELVEQELRRQSAPAKIEPLSPHHLGLVLAVPPLTEQQLCRVMPEIEVEPMRRPLGL